MKTKLLSLLLLSFLFTAFAQAEEDNACRHIIKESKSTLKSIDDSKENIDKTLQNFDSQVTRKNFSLAKNYIQSASRSTANLIKEIRSQIEAAKRGTSDCRDGQRDRLDKFASKLNEELSGVESLQKIVEELKVRI